MFTIKTYLDKSKISGTGVFADEPIKEGELIWRFVEKFDLKLTEDEFQQMPEIAKEFVLHFGYYSTKEGGYIVCIDNAKYTNHSETPNVKMIDELNSIAIKNIEKGEEITENYFDFDELASKKLTGSF